MERFGEILAQLRQNRRMTQAELAKIIFVSSGTISNYEKSIHYPDIEKLIALADYFDVSVDYLLGRSSSKLSPDVFAQPISTGNTVGDFVEKVQRLSSDRKQALCLIATDMEISAMIHFSRKDERP